MVEIKEVEIRIPKECNVIIGQTHFIKTVEDLHELIVNCVPQAKFGIAFNEASGKCLVRHSGNDEELEKLAIEESLKIGAGHTFIIYLKNAYPINILPRLKQVPEIVNIFVATANPLKVLVAVDEKGNKGIIGVIDGNKPRGIEKEEDIKERKEFLRKIGYKL